MSTKTEALPIVATSKVTEMAPKRIFLNVFTDDECAEFPANHEGITWCEDEVGDDDVEYIRADLATARISELEAEVERLRADAERWQALQWHWEDERDMGPGGRWWCSILCDNKPATPVAAIDQARQAQKGGA